MRRTTSWGMDRGTGTPRAVTSRITVATSPKPVPARFTTPGDTESAVTRYGYRCTVRPTAAKTEASMEEVAVMVMVSVSAIGGARGAWTNTVTFTAASGASGPVSMIGVVPAA